MTGSCCLTILFLIFFSYHFFLYVSLYLFLAKVSVGVLFDFLVPA